MEPKILLVTGLIIAIILLAGCGQPEPKCGDGKCNGNETGASCASDCDSGNNSKINTAGWEDSPYVTPDGQKLFFMYTPWNFFPLFDGSGSPVKRGPERKGHHTNAQNGFEDSDIYVSTKNSDGSWSEPQNMPFNDEYSDCCMMPTADGSAIYFAKSFPPNSPTMDLFVVRKNGSEWSTPENLGAPINTDYHEDNPFITKDEQRIYFTSSRPEGEGAEDLWYSDKTGGSWSEPVNMNEIAPGINTALKDDLIWLNDEQTIIYFGRTADPSGYSLFKTELVNGKWTPVEGVNIGTTKPISEISFADNGKTAVFAIIDFEKKDIIISYSDFSNGKWSLAKPID